MSEDTLKAWAHWVSLDKEATDSQKLMAKDISALLAERDKYGSEVVRIIERNTDLIIKHNILRARVTELENTVRLANAAKGDGT